MIFLLHVEWREMPPYKLLLTYYAWRLVWRCALDSCESVAFFYYVYKRFFICVTFLRFFNVFLFFFIWTFFTSKDVRPCCIRSLPRRRRCSWSPCRPSIARPFPLAVRRVPARRRNVRRCRTVAKSDLAAASRARLGFRFQPAVQLVSKRTEPQRRRRNLNWIPGA